MDILFPVPRFTYFRAVGIVFAALLLLPQTFAQTCTTSITGKVYSPNGIDPLPNILVYVPTTAVQALPQGVSTCAAASQLVSGNPLVSTTTAADGSFTLTSPGLAGTQTLVIQAGKWRRQYSGINISACQTTTAPTLAMPQSQSQGSIPAIAISTGSSDAIECVFRKIGIADSEFNAAGSGSGHISLYAGSQSPGITLDASGNTLPNETTLVGSSSTINSYDLAVFACQGTATNPASQSAANQQNVTTFADSGGRVFATHYSYVWLEDNAAFAGTANWVKDVSIGSATTPINATIDQTYPEGVVLANWLYDIGATPTKGQLPLYDTRKDQSGINAPAQSWATLNDTAEGSPVMQFTFDTPINAGSTPTVAATFTNQPSSGILKPGEANGSVLITVTNSTSTAADPSLNLSITLPPGLTATSLTDPTGGWLCSLATLVCNRATSLAAGASDSVTLAFTVATTAPLGQAGLGVAIAGGGLSGTNQCGRVLFNEYHVESASAEAVSFPRECSSTVMTPQEKFLEFSLYNLSNFVAPVFDDTLDIQATPTLSWSTPASIYYGTPLGSTQLDATSNAPGTFAYTPAIGTVLPVGSNTLNAVFTPTDPTSYTGGSISTTIVVLQDTTTTVLTAATNPAIEGTPDALTASVSGNAAAPTGTVSFYNGATLLGTVTLTPSTGDTSTATLSVSNLAIGTNTLTAVYAGNTNFAGSSGQLSLLVKGTSAITITGLVSPIDYGQIIGNTAFVNVIGSSTGGTTTVYIDGVLVCTLPVSSGQTYTCPASTGAGYAVGTHTTYAVFSGDALYQGSTSPTYTVQIVPDPTTTTLTSSLNPSHLGNSVTFNATVAAPYATPTGNVVFLDGTTQLGIAALSMQGTTGQGIAAYSTTALTVGTHNITASYAATTDFNASASTALAQVVNPPLPLNGQPGFILTVTPTTLNAPVGAATPIAVTIQEVNGYSSAIALTCTGLPTEATCAFAQSTIAAGSGSTTLYLTPSAPHACGSSTPFFVASLPSWPGGITLTLLSLLALRRRKLFTGLTLILALSILPLLSGCGTVGCTDLGTKPGTYSFTVTATPAISGTGVEGTQSQTVTFTATL